MITSFKKLILCAFCALGIVACSDKDAPMDPIAQNGMLPGEFSVSAHCKVHFSQGNLQYQSSTGVWQFATYQWDAIGKEALINHDDWRDLFIWGEDLTIITSTNTLAFLEWGKYPIRNGGNKADEWRTLSMEEWRYLFHGRKKAQSLFGFGEVYGVNGVIILPDNWFEQSDTYNFNASDNTGLIWKSNYYIGSGNDTVYYYYYLYDNDDKIFSHNKYTAKKWHEMELAGAVFLPAAGNYLEEMNGGRPVGEYGNYWSSTCFGNDVYCLNFYQAGLLPMCHGRNDYCFSVRLVR